MPLTKSRAASFAIAAIVVIEIFQLAVGSVVLFVFGGRTSGVEKLMLFIPFFSLPILILAIRKLGLATQLMWILFGIFNAWYINMWIAKISWGRIWTAVHMILKLDWPLLAICILLTILYCYQKPSGRFPRCRRTGSAPAA